MERRTVPSLRQQKANGQKLTMVTAYDAPTAKLVESAEVDIILVGDSLGMVVLGYENTLAVTMEDMLHHVKAARRGAKQAMLVADMPYLSYGVNVEETVRNAGRFVKEGGAEAVKLEGGDRVLPDVRALTHNQIPVMGHLGLTPQSVNAFGGFTVQGKTAARAHELCAEAQRLEEAGIFALVLEGLPRETAAFITARLGIPTIGIGAGPDTDGQVLVFHDLLGLHDGHYPKFVRTYADGYRTISDALRRYVADVVEGSFPGKNESYHLKSAEASRLRDDAQ